MRKLSVVLVVVVSGCFAPPDERPGAPADAEALPTRPGTASTADGCVASKLQFTRAQACWNDGWIELCAERAGGTPLVNELRHIAPSIFISDAPMGRVGCNPTTELTAIYAFDRGQACEADGATMRPEAWETVCRLSAVEGTRIFVPGFGE